MNNKKQSLKKQIIELKDKLETLEKNMTILTENINKISIEKQNPPTNTTKHYKTPYKYNKVLKILEQLKKNHTEYFTLNDYKKALIKNFGQNDTRTIKSDIEMLELTNQIIKKNKKYYFT